MDDDSDDDPLALRGGDFRNHPIFQRVSSLPRTSSVQQETESDDLDGPVPTSDDEEMMVVEAGGIGGVFGGGSGPTGAEGGWEEGLRWFARRKEELSEALQEDEAQKIPGSSVIDSHPLDGSRDISTPANFTSEDLATTGVSPKLPLGLSPPKLQDAAPSQLVDMGNKDQIDLENNYIGTSVDQDNAELPEEEDYDMAESQPIFRPHPAVLDSVLQPSQTNVLEFLEDTILLNQESQIQPPTNPTRQRSRSPPIASDNLPSPSTLFNLAPRPPSSPRSQSLTPPPSLPQRSSPPPPLPPPPPPPPPPKSPSDPLLDAFRSVRTFRTRTAIQLQPYTREKKRYTEMVKTGGKRLIRELMHDDPDEEVLSRQRREDGSAEVPFGEYRSGLLEDEEGEDEEETLESREIDAAPDSIVLVEVQDEDYDQYFTKYGQVAESPSNLRLQTIAKKRLRSIEVERRKQIKEDRLLKKAREEIERELERNMREKQKAERARQRAIADAKRKDREERKKDKVDGGRGEARGRLRSDSEGEEDVHIHKKRKKTPRVETHASGSDELPEAATLLRGNSHASGSSRRLSPTPDLDRAMDTEDLSSPFSLNAFPDMDSRPMDLEADADVEVVGHRQASKRPRPSDPLLSDSEDEPTSTEGAVAPKKKVKVLKRVLPAFMIKKLAADQAKRDQARAGRTKADTALNPPHATRRGRKEVRRSSGGAEMADFFDDESINTDSNAGPQILDGPEDVPVLQMFSSDSEMSLLSSSDDDQADDDDAAESVRMLDHGEFDSLLFGGRRMPVKGNSERLRLGKMVHNKNRINTLPRRMRQPGLNLPLRRQKAQTGQKRSKRRIVMDDDTIFEHNSAPRRPLQQRQVIPQHRQDHRASPLEKGGAIRAPPRFAKGSSPAASASASSPRGPPPAHAPARPAEDLSLWDDIKEFQLDFDVKPLASGVSLGSESFLGSGKLMQLMVLLNDEAEYVASSSAVQHDVYGLTLDPAMVFTELEQAMPIILDGILSDISALSNSRKEPTDCRILESLDYLCDQACNPSATLEVSTPIISLLVEVAAGSREAKLPKAQPASVDYLLQAACAVVICLWKVYKSSDPVIAAATILPAIADASADLTLKLLRYGFNRTMKPLKDVMAYLADSPSISEFSAECWVMLLHTLQFAENIHDANGLPSLSLQSVLDRAIDAFFVDQDKIGPRASEKIWYLAFGLASLGQFDVNGITRAELDSRPLWHLVRRALLSISLPHMDEAEEIRKRHHLRSRDRYVKVMIVRCLRLNSIWQWQCDKESFQIATRDLGTIYKERHHRNFPTETASDYPAFISEYDLAKTEEIDMEDSAYNLYLRLLAITASDLVASASSVAEAQGMVKEVQRLMLAIFPFSGVGLLPHAVPNSRQTAALINRYSTAVVACLFVPTLLPWLLNNAQKWFDFSTAHIETRRIAVRGLMYLAVASRHHNAPLKPVIDKLAEAFEEVRADRDKLKEGDLERNSLSRMLVLIIGGFRHIIKTPSFHTDGQNSPVYPDPILLHRCWTSRLNSAELVTDRRAGNEIIDCIQAFLDARHLAMPDKIRRNRASRLEDASQQSGFDDFGIDFTDGDILALGGAMEDVPPEYLMDQEVAKVLVIDISPGLYGLLSNTFSGGDVDSTSLANLDTHEQADRQTYISKLTKCWADCASVLVVDHKEREWSTYLGYGKESWERFGEEHGRRQIGLSFMLNVARLDPNAFSAHAEEFIALFLQALVANLVTIEPQYISAMISMPGASEHPLLAGLGAKDEPIYDRATFGRHKIKWLGVIFGNDAHVLGMMNAQSGLKPFVYRCINLILSAMQLNYQLIHPSKLSQRIFYSAFCDEVVSSLKSEAGRYITELSVPKLKAFPMHRALIREGGGGGRLAEELVMVD